MPTIIPAWVKIAALAALAAALILIVRMISGWHDDALKLPVVSAEFDQYRKQAEKDKEQLIIRNGIDEQAKSDWKSNLDSFGKKIDGLQNRPPIKEVTYHETVLADGKKCPDPRISDDFASLYNAASDAANTAVRKTD